MLKNNILKVKLGKRSYNILIGNNLIKETGILIKPLLQSNKTFIVTDDNVAKFFLHDLQKSLDKEQITHESFILPHGEKTKSFDQLQYLLDMIFTHKPDRKTTLIALGGGVIGDLTGFAASIVLRGINFIQIPTTLLAQVDSSVGGKTGINNRYGKNLIGSFHQPIMVLSDIETIKNLPIREFLAGYAEIAKYGLINDAAFFDYLEHNTIKILAHDAKVIQYIVNQSCAAKAKIVAEDEFETGNRALLNLGHTFGHALEKCTDYNSEILLHGEAVAVGIIFVFKLSHALNLCSGIDVERVIQHFKTIGMRTSPLQIKKNWNTNELLSAMQQDKKATNGKLTFILVKGIGSSFIEKAVDEGLVSKVISEFVGHT